MGKSYCWLNKTKFLSVPFPSNLVWRTQCPSVCLSVIKVEIVDYGQTVRVFVFFHKLELLFMVLRILNLEGHQNSLIGSKVITIYQCFSSSRDFHSSWSCIEWWSGDRWKVTHDMWQILFFLIFVVTDAIISANVQRFSVSSMRDFHRIGPWAASV